jgi:hypothetical protein
MADEQQDVTPEFAAAAAAHHDDVVIEAAQRQLDGAKSALDDLDERHARERDVAEQAVEEAQRALDDAQSERDRWADLAGDAPLPPRVEVIVRARVAEAGASAPRPGKG